MIYLFIFIYNIYYIVKHTWRIPLTIANNSILKKKYEHYKLWLLQF